MCPPVDRPERLWQHHVTRKCIDSPIGGVRESHPQMKLNTFANLSFKRSRDLARDGQIRSKNNNFTTFERSLVSTRHLRFSKILRLVTHIHIKLVFLLTNRSTSVHRGLMLTNTSYNKQFGSARSYFWVIKFLRTAKVVRFDILANSVYRFVDGDMLDSETIKAPRKTFSFGLLSF